MPCGPCPAFVLEKYETGLAKCRLVHTLTAGIKQAQARCSDSEITTISEITTFGLSSRASPLLKTHIQRDVIPSAARTGVPDARPLRGGVKARSRGTCFSPNRHWQGQVSTSALFFVPGGE